jgi:hypothetical protein
MNRFRIYNGQAFRNLGFDDLDFHLINYYIILLNQIKINSKILNTVKKKIAFFVGLCMNLRHRTSEKKK